MNNNITAASFGMNRCVSFSGRQQAAETAMQIAKEMKKSKLVKAIEKKSGNTAIELAFLDDKRELVDTMAPKLYKCYVDMLDHFHQMVSKIGLPKPKINLHR